MALQKSTMFAANGIWLYTPDAPFPFNFEHLQASAGRSLNGVTQKQTVRWNVVSFQNIRYSAMTVREFYETFKLLMADTKEFFNFTYYDPTLLGLNTVSVYCNRVSGSLMSIEGDGLVKDVSFTLVEE